MSKAEITMHVLVSFVYRLVSDCANATSKAGYEYFGIQFWAECWSGESYITYNAVGKSEKYFVIPFIQKCDDSPCLYCAGANAVNYVYKINS